ncbi:AmmeMemoRadiSam system protein B [Candidatus Falkowbacteria bacterium RIFOXYD2_FULL_35_9]|uniref:AmmeMemoRadiSam system protein B n=1 Tax=Candidatus Falkowbacteria bacterium RIFOXYC2_FULL_36_12 TaxID=1798002 RepID=A0A1F5T0J1_9BACT|nr:MAG: AmmeMemoRadiSam system protein B [Candidatus Falkowbacteria bacterium RIFOXYB2_FULL_35_7]OGF32432.1 MAG: AmmeMemoRadiSam system protein B [Candidatus Falkowbacteria bacterium RIFOXYC2_FULL_36_12]OGF33838.1 MAG: AmmeMemoRadiSam system protein B [Candidatus Falkowbacteria bacterium RIFOXYA2_FULL_35_8]OGF46781.1 MAG: AmmeMemoRadiSam system protein B [Candidatus Falkowbacteria bacterium RIFOXYD2_FULL_35_9]
MLVFSAILPHSPLLIPSIGKENIKKLQKTIEAIKILRQDFESTRPDLVIVLTSHGDIYPEAFSINTLPEYKVNFGEFGDFQTNQVYKGDIGFINRFKEQVESSMSLSLKSLTDIDYATAVPLIYLAENYKNFKIVPINYSFLSYEQHLKFGEALKEAIYREDKRVAIIASAELSHKLTPKAPAGFSPNAKEFDKKIIQLLKQKKVESILNLDKAMVEDAAECGLRSILIMLGVIKNMNYDFQVLNYESPFGIGHLVAEFKLK